MKPETAGGRLLLLLLLLLAAVLTGTRADPVPRATRLPPEAKDCHIARFKSLSPQVLQAFKKAKDAIEERLLKKDVRCSSRLFPRAWDLQQLQVQERPKALQAELALTLKVLENVTDPALGPILDQPLHTLHHIHSQLQACTQPQPTAEPRPLSRRLSRWMNKLQEAQRKHRFSTYGPGPLWITYRVFTLHFVTVAKLQSVSHRELGVFKKAKDALVHRCYHNGLPYSFPAGMEMEELLLRKDVRCRTNLFPSSRKLGQLQVLFLTCSQVQERPKALQAELALTLKVLENVTDPALGPILDQPLHTLHHIHSQLQACTQPQPTAEPRPLSRRLSRWMNKLQEAQRKETPSCLEASVTSNLFHLLTWDLKCVASGDQCV
ncbi:hypothetical protein STEG23_028390 [Scotinomys teguina]